MQKVAITDYTFENLEIEARILNPLGVMIAEGQCKTPSEVAELTTDADYIITQFAPMNAQVINALQKARIIVRYGIGVDNVDLEAARQKGIPVCNVPDYCIPEVADHALALILATTRQILPMSAIVREGSWGYATPLSAMKCLNHMTVGVVGFGRIGRAVCQRLQAFGCEVLVFDPAVEAEEIQRLQYMPVGFAELLSRSDVVTLHCPSNAHTRRMMNRESFGQMKLDGIFVNVSRGDLVETEALVEALQGGTIGAAALDVCDPEPLPAVSLLRTLPNVIVTSHIASISTKAVTTLRESVAESVARAIRGEALTNVVNGVTPS